MAQLQTSRAVRGEVDELRSGDRMTREEFHRIYERMPEDFKAELVGGIVYVASPLRVGHGTAHSVLNAALAMYMSATPGVEAGDNVTVLLSDDSEPQPDLFLRILPKYGGQSKTTKGDYLQGPPELLAEIAYSSRAIDLHAKRDIYARYGVLEYLVLSLKERELKWFDLRANKELAADSDGVCRVHAFPGLWIHVEAILQRNYQQLMAMLKQGLESPEHADFVAKLASAHKPRG
ncbi:MAG: Uma2 family endonuclease [Tepidisphaeraceae bacterium]|jgi:putative restriction endonuclease